MATSKLRKRLEQGDLDGTSSKVTENFCLVSVSNASAQHHW
jgi:hypothetical protein